MQVNRPPRLITAALLLMMIGAASPGCTHDNAPPDGADSRGGGVGLDGARLDGAVFDGAVFDGAGLDGGVLDGGRLDVRRADVGADVTVDAISVPTNTPPTAQWIKPVGDTLVLLGDEIQFIVQVGDDSTKPADLGLSLTLTDAAAPQGVFLNPDTTGKISFSLSSLPAGKNELVLTVYDEDGETATAKLTVLINTAPGAPVVAIEPAAAMTTDALKVALLQPAVDLDDGPLPANKHSYQWSLGNKVITDLIGATVPANRTQAGETWRVVVRATDGSAVGLAGKAAVTINNSAPGSVAIKLESVLPGEVTPTVASTLRCVVTKKAVDADGDAVKYLIRWTLDGLALPEAGTADTVVLGSKASAAWRPVLLAQVGGVQAGAVLGCRVNATDGFSVGPVAEATVSLAAFDSCADGAHGCGANTVCKPTKSTSPSCFCAAGYVDYGAGCQDINECFAGTATCAKHAACSNTKGSYDCPCDPGWSGDGSQKSGCKDVNECSDGTAVCDLAASCTNTTGAYACNCDDGYEGDGLKKGGCEDIDECGRGLAVCDLAASCTNTVGGYACVCKDGYKGDGKSCVDVDECGDGTDGCDLAALCTNTAGGYTCTCKDGFSGDGKTCADVDECKAGAYTCDAHATCVNTSGGYDCSCDVGWTGSGKTCVDVDECKTGMAQCSAQATCGNTSGGYFCGCKSGWYGLGLGADGCSDVDECKSGQYVCSAAATCANTAGGYGCVCKTGYEGDGKVCVDIDECAKGTASCAAAAICSNASGGYQCTCKSGWVGDGKTCKPGAS